VRPGDRPVFGLQHPAGLGDGLPGDAQAGSRGAGQRGGQTEQSGWRALALPVMTFGFSSSVRPTARHYESGQHLWSARHYARLCANHETALLRGDLPIVDIQHRTYASSAVLSSVAFLESLGNEVFQDAADVTPDPVSDRIAPIGEQGIGLMGEFWNESASRYAGVLDKLQMALLFANKPRLDPGAFPYQDAKLLLGIRNLLVHFKPAWRTEGDETKLEQGLMGKKFPENPLMAGTGNAWFPFKCLGAGCSAWVCTVSQAVADEWTERLGIPRYYGDDSDRANKWPEP
jgi:hypothetical protein